MKNLDTEGWGWPVNSKKAHYFKDARSLCGRWLFMGSSLEADFPSGQSPDECVQCWKVRNKKKAKEAKPSHFDLCINDNCERKKCVDRRNPPRGQNG